MYCTVCNGTSPCIVNLLYRYNIHVGNHIQNEVHVHMYFGSNKYALMQRFSFIQSVQVLFSATVLLTQVHTCTCTCRWRVIEIYLCVCLSVHICVCVSVPL